MDLAGVSGSKKTKTWLFIGVIYLVTKKITVDNVVEGRGKSQATALGTRYM
jgi:hypothetical protein